LTQNNTFSHLQYKFLSFYFFHSNILPWSRHGQGLQRNRKISAAKWPELTVDYGGKAVDSPILIMSQLNCCIK